MTINSDANVNDCGYSEFPNVSDSDLKAAAAFIKLEGENFPIQAENLTDEKVRELAHYMRIWMKIVNAIGPAEAKNLLDKIYYEKSYVGTYLGSKMISAVEEHNDEIIFSNRKYPVDLLGLATTPEFISRSSDLICEDLLINIQKEFTAASVALSNGHELITSPDAVAKYYTSIYICLKSAINHLKTDPWVGVRLTNNFLSVAHLFNSSDFIKRHLSEFEGNLGSNYRNKPIESLAKRLELANSIMSLMRDDAEFSTTLK